MAGDVFSTDHSKNLKTNNFRTKRRIMPPSGINENTGSFIPIDEGSLPPMVLPKDNSSTEFEYRTVLNTPDLVLRLKDETLKFALEKNLFVFVRIVQCK